MIRFLHPAWQDFTKFAAAQIDSGDLDPMYPVLREFYEREHLNQEQAYWFTALYVTYYHVGTALEVWKKLPEPPRNPASLWLEPTSKTGIERRGMRGNDLPTRHLRAWLEAASLYGGLSGWVRETTAPGGCEGWRRLRSAFQTVPYAGPWASYKLADLLANAHKWPITAPDLGVGGGGETAGPIPGMVRLTGEPWKRCATDRGLQAELFREASLAVPGIVAMEQLETALCDFNSMAKGRYYVGHDIDEMMTRLPAAERSALGASLWAARLTALNTRYLGELHGWWGVRHERCDHYRRTGEVLLA